MPVKILMADEDPAVLEMAGATVSTLTWCDLVTVDDGLEAAEGTRPGLLRSALG